jgi:hypothetical protein
LAFVSTQIGRLVSLECFIFCLIYLTIHCLIFEGYIVNFYNLSRHDDDDPVWAGVSQARLEALPKSEMYRVPEGQCANDGDARCLRKSFICHHVTADLLRGVTAKIDYLPLNTKEADETDLLSLLSRARHGGARTRKAMAMR